MYTADTISSTRNFDTGVCLNSSTPTLVDSLRWTCRPQLYTEIVRRPCDTPPMYAFGRFCAFASRASAKTLRLRAVNHPGMMIYWVWQPQARLQLIHAYRRNCQTTQRTDLKFFYHVCELVIWVHYFCVVLCFFNFCIAVSCLYNCMSGCRMA